MRRPVCRAWRVLAGTGMLVVAAPTLGQGTGSQTAAPVSAHASSPAARPASAVQQVQVEGRSDADQLRRDAIGALTVIDREALDRHGDTSVLDVLQRQPGVSVDGDQPRIRGLGGGYTLILINGEPAPPGFSLEQLSPAEIERIEVVKGPSAEFGGVAGTLNIILRSPPRTRQREARAQVHYRALRPAGSVWGGWGDRDGALGWHLPVSVYQWAGKTLARTERVTRSRDGELRAQRSQSRDPWWGGGANFGPRIDWRPREGQALHWQTFLQQHESDNRGRFAVEPRAGTPPSVLAGESTSQGQWQLARTQLQWIERTPAGARWELKALAEWSAGRSAGRLDALQGTAVPLQRDQRQWHTNRRVSAGARLRWPLGEGHAALGGIDIEQREREEQRDLIENGRALRTDSVGLPFEARMGRVTAFVQDDWGMSERLSLALGWRHEWVQTESRLRPVSVAAGVADGRRDSVGGPVLQARWTLAGEGPSGSAPAAGGPPPAQRQAGWVMRASLARTARLPELAMLMDRYALNTTDERDQPNSPLSPDQAGHPGLRPERAWGLELGAERGLGDGGVFSVTAHARSIDDLIRRRIALEPVAESAVPRWVSRPVNLGSARTRGLDFEWKGAVGEGSRDRAGQEGRRPAATSPWQARFAVGLHRSSVAQVDGPDARLEGQPPWTLTLGLDRRPQAAQPGSAWPGHVGAGASFTYTPAYTTRQTDLQQVWRNRVQRLDLYLVWRPDPAVNIRLAVQNLLPGTLHTRSEVRDLDGFTASTEQWRENLRTVQASLVLRF